ncbi:MAG: MFS transporter, partial [Actinomycetota bacterium]|nr:MFS transporter [Actinomycetota bacterium]
MSGTGETDAGTAAAEPDNQLEVGDPFEAADVRTLQRKSVGVLGGSQVLGGVAVAGSLPAGALIAESISGSEAAAGLAQTFGVVGAALLALPLARVALSRGRRAALAGGYFLGSLGSIIVIAGAVYRSLAIVYAGCLFVGVASAAGLQARYAATDLASANRRARSLSIVVWGATIGAVAGPNLLDISGRWAQSLGLPPLAGPYLVAAVVCGVTVGLLLVFLRPDPYRESLRLRRDVDPGVSRPRIRDGIEHLKNRPRAVLGIGAVAIGHVAMVMVMVMTPVHMAHVDVSLQLIGLVISVHVAGMYALSPLVGMAVDRFGRLTVIGAGVVILLTACAVIGLAPADDVVTLGIGLFLLGLGWS